jgi:hypothetical protein
MQSSNILATLSDMFDNYSKMFFEYKFLIRDSAVLIAIDPILKEMFSKNQAKRIEQIETLILFLIDKEIVDIAKDEVKLRAKLHWFISAYWQVFTSTSTEVTKESIAEAKDVIFRVLIYPNLTQKAKESLKDDM